MASIKEQIEALRARFGELQAALGVQAKLNPELRNKLARLNSTLDLLVEADEKVTLLIHELEKK
jgi:chromosome segregation ATPase